MFRRLYIKWLEWRGKAVDIWSKSDYPADALFNLCSNGFRFDGMVCGSMEGFLQSLKQKDKDKQRQICSMEGKNGTSEFADEWIEFGSEKFPDRNNVLEYLNVNGNQQCSNFGNSECSIFGIKTTVLLASAVQ